MDPPVEIRTGAGAGRELVRHSTCDKGHEEGGSAYAKDYSAIRKIRTTNTFYNMDESDARENILCESFYMMF